MPDEFCAISDSFITPAAFTRGHHPRGNDLRDSLEAFRVLPEFLLAEVPTATRGVEIIRSWVE